MGTSNYVPRQTIVVDLECSGLYPEKHVATEVSYWNLDTDESDTFIPMHDVRKVLMYGQPKALEMTNYVERIANAPQDSGNRKLARLFGMLSREWDSERGGWVGNTLAGANPRFDARFLSNLFRTNLPGSILRINYPDEYAEPWHHRVHDVEMQAKVVLGLDYIPGLHDLCERLGINADDMPNHHAGRDVLATGLAIRKLDRLQRMLHVAYEDRWDSKITEEAQAS